MLIFLGALVAAAGALLIAGAIGVTLPTFGLSLPASMVCGGGGVGGVSLGAAMIAGGSALLYSGREKGPKNMALRFWASTRREAEQVEHEQHRTTPGLAC